MFNKKPISILYLDVDGFTYYTEGITELKFTYPSASIKALEIVDEILLVNETTRFIQSNKIMPTNMMIIIGEELLYEKDFPDQVLVAQDKKDDKNNEQIVNSISNTSKIENTTDQNLKTVNSDSEKNVNSLNETLESNAPISIDEQRAFFLEERSRQIQAFIDIVPVEEVASKIYKKVKGVKVVVTNKKLYEVFVKIFTKQLFIVDSIVPISVIDNETLSEKIMNKENFTKIVKKFETIRQLSLFEENSYSLTRAAIEPHGIQMTTKVTSKREYVLIGVFVCLILVLGIISYTTFIAPASERKVASISQINTPTPFMSPTIAPSITPVSSDSAVLIKENIKIQISGGTDAQASQLQNTLLDSGFLNVFTAPNNTTSTGRVLVVFSPTVSEFLRTQLLNELRKSVLNVTVQESQITEFNVIINI